MIETPAVMEVVVERDLEPLSCSEEGGEGSCQFSPQLKACQWWSYVPGALGEGKQERENRPCCP